MHEIRQTLAFQKWLRRLPDRTVKVRLVRRIERLAVGQPGDQRFLGGGHRTGESAHRYPGYRNMTKRPGTRSLKTIPFDTADYLDDDETRLAYLNAVLAEGDPREILAALGTIARARGMSTVARSAGLGRESLYKALGENGNPEFKTILSVAAALGFRFEARVAEK
jgi:probable addiction module antidote protein